MRARLPYLLLLLAGLAQTCAAADSVHLKITHIGLEGIYSAASEPTWVEVSARNNTARPVSFRMSIVELNLFNEARPSSEVVTVPLELAASETREISVPLHINAEPHAVLYVQALDGSGNTIGRTAIKLGGKPEGEYIAMLCANGEICRKIREAILLSGSAEEQTHKSSSLRLLELSKAPPAGWAYSPADIIILATPASQLSNAQRDALEIYMRRGGKLVLIDDQSGNGAATAGTRLLEAYRARTAEGKDLTVGEGLLAHLKSVSGREFSDYFRPLGFTPNTPEEIRAALQGRMTGKTSGEPGQLNLWLIHRLGTTFHFPSFFELLCWIIGYLVLGGIVNFVILRRIGRPDWAWVTLPGLAVLFSLLLYAVGVRNHPSHFGIDEMTVYRLDSLSPLALTTSRVRVSAPVRSVVHPVLPGDVVLGIGRRPRFQFAGGQFLLNGQSAFLSEIQIGANWETSFLLRRWSFRDLEFEGQRRFAGTVLRDAQGRMRNETGIHFRQALVADGRDVFFLGEFPAGAVVDLGHVPHHPYEEQSGRVTSNNVPNFPAPPFAFRLQVMPESASEEWMKRSDEEFKNLKDQPFALSELIRGWPKHGEIVFSETKAVFFGLSSEPTLGATLREREAVRKAASLVVVTYGEWP